MDDKELAWEVSRPEKFKWQPPVPADSAPEAPEPAPEAPEPAPEQVAPAVDYHKARRVFSRIGFAVAVLLVLGSLAQIGAVALTRALAPGLLENGWFFWAVTMLPLYVVGFPVFLALLPKREYPAAPAEKLSFKNYFPLFFIGYAMMYAGNLVGILVSSIYSGLSGMDVVNPVESLITATSVIPMAAIVVVIGPIMEELIFRKLLIDRMRPYGERLAVFTTALMFGLFHGNLAQMFYAFTLGLLFGYVYLRTGKLRYSIGLHMFINFMGSVVGLFMTSLDFDPIALMEAAELGDFNVILEMLPAMLIMMGYGILVLAMVITGVVLFLLRRRRIHYAPAPQQLTRGWVFRTAYKNWGMLAFLAACLGLVVISLV